ncbi:MAG: hypothetical protein EXR98_21615 [Gemmataceae bacterium]|nr:hypothetical protein [Gemmataceae bacterium]
MNPLRLLWLLGLVASVAIFAGPGAADVQAGPGGGTKEEQAELWFAFREIIETRCLKCHDGPTSPSGVNLNDYRNLTKAHGEDRDIFEFEWLQKPWYYVKPGNARCGAGR